MVKQNMGLPEPPEQNTSLSSSDIILVNSDTEDFDANGMNPYEGYQQLQTNDAFDAAMTQTHTHDSSASDSNDEFGQQDEFQEGIGSARSEVSNVNAQNAPIPPIDSCEKTILKAVWSETQSKDIEMDSDKVKAVKDAMLNFTLPASNIPDWANTIPEEEWKTHILERLHDNKSK